MKFDENLRELRKQAGYSQEELAEKLNVSRQAVSKWENGSSYPELDKLMMLCDLFHCTIDNMLQKDLKDKDCVNVEAYEKMENKRSIMVTAGVMLIFAGVVLYGFIQTMVNENTLHTIFLMIIAIAVLIFVYSGMQYDAFKKKYPKAPQQIYKEEDFDHINKVRNISVIVGIALIFIGVATNPIFSAYVGEKNANSIFVLFIMVAVGIFIYVGMQYQKYQKTTILLKSHDERESLIGKVCGVIMILTSIVFLVWSFIWGAWEISWVVFPVGGLLCGIVSIILHKEEKV